MTRKQMIYLAVGILVLTTVAGLAGWLFNDWSRHSRSVRVTEIFAGKVVYTNDPRSAAATSGCVQGETGRPRICSDFFVPAGTVVRMGDEVLAAHEWVFTGGGTGYDLLVLYPKTPPP